MSMSLMMLLFLQQRSTFISLSRSSVNLPEVSQQVTFDFASIDSLDGHLRPVHFAVPFENIPELPTPDLLIQYVNIHRLRHFLFL